MSRHFIQDADLLAQLSDEQRDDIEVWLESQPVTPQLIGATASSKLLGVQPPHISRLREQGRMPDPIPVEGSADVYIRSEVESLARELKSERAARAARKESKT